MLNFKPKSLKIAKKILIPRVLWYQYLRTLMAEKQRFELWRGLHPLMVFKTIPFSRLGISPYMFTLVNWWTRRDLNPRPAVYETAALTNCATGPNW